MTTNMAAKSIYKMSRGCCVGKYRSAYFGGVKRFTLFSYGESKK